MAKTISIAEDVMDVLKRSAITENSLTLPEQLDRKLYTKVSKIIEAAGGKWNKKAKAHVFPSDPREILGLAIETGKVDNKQQIFQQFFTPSELAADMCRDVQPGDFVLEPSAGAGSIAAAAAANGAGCVLCYELQPELAEKLEALGFAVNCGDFLESSPEARFKHVLMNPPFTAGQFQKHVQHAFKFLSNGGTLKAIGPANLGGNRTKAQKQFMEWLDTLDHWVTELPASTFKSEGTNIDTVLLTIRI